MTDDLVQFIRDRLDGDWQFAYEAGDGGHDTWHFNPDIPWESDSGPREAVVHFTGSAMGYVAAVDPVHGKYGTWNARHIARWDPARVLADVDAKRQVLRDLEQAEFTLSKAGREGTPYDLMTGAVNTLRRTVRLLAAPYRGHPDYRPEWAPDA